MVFGFECNFRTAAGRMSGRSNDERALCASITTEAGACLMGYFSRKQSRALETVIEACHPRVDQ